MMDLYEVTGAAGRLAIALRPRGGDWLGDELRAFVRPGWTHLVTTLEDAELVDLELVELGAACAAAGAHWIRLPIADRDVPDLRTARDFAARLHALLVEGAAIAVHCRQGIGRSSLVVASVLVAAGVPPEEAWRRVGEARGREVPDTAAQRKWLYSLADVS